MKKAWFFISGFICAIFAIAIFGFFMLNDRVSISDKSVVSAEKPRQFSKVQIVNLNTTGFDSILKDSKQKTIVNFWASWCKPCIQEMPHLLDYCKERNIKLILISADKNTPKQIENLKKQMRQFSFDKTYLIKENSFMDITGKDSYYSFLKNAKIPHNSQNTGIPFFIFIENGKIKKTFNGPIIQNLYGAFYDKQIK